MYAILKLIQGMIKRQGPSEWNIWCTKDAAKVNLHGIERRRMKQSQMRKEGNKDIPIILLETITKSK